MTCPFCQYKHDNEGDRYGCPNCEGSPMNSTTRVLKHRQEAAKQGRKRKEYLVSDDEHVRIKALIKDIRCE